MAGYIIRFISLPQKEKGSYSRTTFALIFISSLEGLTGSRHTEQERHGQTIPLTKLISS